MIPVIYWPFSVKPYNDDKVQNENKITNGSRGDNYWYSFIIALKMVQNVGLNEHQR